MTAADAPRILFQSVPDDLRPVFAGLPGQHDYIDGGEDVHPSDHDLLVTFESSPRVDDSWHVLGFGMEDFDASSHFFLTEPENRAREAVVAESEWASKHQRLIQRTIIDVIAPVPRRVWYAGRWVGQFPDPVSGDDLRGEVEPLVHLGREKGIYAMLAKGPEETLIWALPAETTDHRAWLILVLETLHVVDPERFPGQPEWRKGDDWAPVSLREASAARDSQIAERDRLLAEAEQRIAQADSAVESERAAAEAGSWQLLTADGDELVHAVRDALEVFGFEARELDDENRIRHGRRLEDLRVTDPAEPEWESLVEVKGYSKGAKVNDVSQVTGAASIYFRMDHGREPRTVWHVVNVERGKDPSLRRPAIIKDEDLEVLTKAGGALIDTRELFRAVRDVEGGAVSPEEVRESLRGAVTRWPWLSR